MKKSFYTLLTSGMIVCNLATSIEAKTPHHYFKDGSCTAAVGGMIVCIGGIGALVAAAERGAISQKRFEALRGSSAFTSCFSLGLIFLGSYLGYHTHVGIKNWLFPDAIMDTQAIDSNKPSKQNV